MLLSHRIFSVALLILLLAVAGCVRQPVPPLPLAPVATVPPTPPPTLDESQWHTLYRRPGWNDGPALDLRAVGDVMLGRFVGAAAARRGYDYPFTQVGALLSEGDLTLGNLESPLTDRRDTLRPGPYRLPADPAFAPMLRAAGFDALALANNHALDAGPQGLADAVNALISADVAPLGAGPDAAAAHAPVLRTSNGLRVALLAFNDVTDPEDSEEAEASYRRAWLDDDAPASVRAARQEADLVLVMVHWGTEYAATASARQEEWAQRLVSAGADLVLGAHPHVLQPTELLDGDGRKGFVAYSLGNFVFDQPFSVETSTGVVLRVLLDKEGVAAVAAAPVAISDGQPRPLPLDQPQAQQAIAALNADDGRRTEDDDRQSLTAWSWHDTAATPAPVPPGTTLAERPTHLPADLRGNGVPLWVALEAQGVATVRDGPDASAALLWRNEDAAWRVTRIDVGDPNDDGRIEAIILLWKPDATGRLQSHPFLVGWRSGRYRVIWGGSATTTPIQDLAVADLDGDGRSELVVLEGGSAPGDAADHVAVWHWHGWGFQLEWRSAAGHWTGLALQDLDGDGRSELVAQGE